MIGCIVVAAGYGSLREVDGRPFPKVLETIDGIPLVSRAVRAAEAVGISDVAVVVNPRDRELVTRALAASLRTRAIARFPHMVVQSERRGSADAVLHAIPALRAGGCERALITYGDMPMWSTSTFRLLCSRSTIESVATMVTVPRHPDHPMLDRYGRVVRNARGNIERIVEVDDVQVTPEIVAIDRVNPSLWIWNLRWLQKAIQCIKPVTKSDGYGDERYMPPLVALAASEGLRIDELSLTMYWSHEARGVNNLADLRALEDVMCE